MEHFNVLKYESDIRIDGFPDAVKVIALEGPQANRLSDLALHRSDLQFADTCLNEMIQNHSLSTFVREALWRSAIVHFMKCFGDAGVRFQLPSDKILKGEPPEASTALKYFKIIRNKHFVHDENSHAQSLPGAIVNNETMAYKIEKIVCFSAFAETLTDGNYGNLKLLIQKALAWVEAEFDELCARFTRELENETYDNLLARKSLAYRVPTHDDIEKERRGTNRKGNKGA